MSHDAAARHPVATPQDAGGEEGGDHPSGGRASFELFGGDCRFCEMTRQHHPQCARRLPKRIILVRHGESQGNLDMSAYTTTPDYRIPLTALGAEQARAAGRGIRTSVAKMNASAAARSECSGRRRLQIQLRVLLPSSTYYDDQTRSYPRLGR